MSNFSNEFITAARDALSFLERDHGFILSETDTESRFEIPFGKILYRKLISPSRELFVCLSTAPTRFERDLEFGRGWPPQHSETIQLDELLAVEAPEFQMKFQSGIHEGFGDHQKMSQQYTELGNALKNYGGRFFADDQALWDSVHELRKSNLQICRNEEISHSAESAFKENDWQKCIELLEILGDCRTKLQTSRLEYARKHISKL